MTALSQLSVSLNVYTMGGQRRVHVSVYGIADGVYGSVAQLTRAVNATAADGLDTDDAEDLMLALVNEVLYGR